MPPKECTKKREATSPLSEEEPAKRQATMASLKIDIIESETEVSASDQEQVSVTDAEEGNIMSKKTVTTQRKTRRKVTISTCGRKWIG